MLIPSLTPGDGQVLTRAEVAHLFRIEPSTVTRWAEVGRLRSFRTLGGHRRYYASEVRTRLRDAGQNP